MICRRLKMKKRVVTAALLVLILSAAQTALALDIRAGRINPFADNTLTVISDEPGLYIDEEEIGIRIEDDLLITETGCEVLSRDIIRDPDEIERFMRG